MSNLKLIITRHGKSIWNKENKFVGWSDIGLSSSGIMKSIELSNTLINNNIVPNIIYTSALNRSIIISELIQRNILNKTTKKKLDIVKTWRLNEKNYGILEGVNKEDAIKKYGKLNINNIENKYYYMPYINSIKNKAIIDNNILVNDDINTTIGESLNMIYKRLYPLWSQKIIQDLYYHETLMIISHKNTIKVLMQIIENLNIEDVEKLDINNSNLIIYNFDKQLNLLNKNILN
jgi:2,3-bisphosphoglycerate-dependent phosphoglycerate mutase